MGYSPFPMVLQPLLLRMDTQLLGNTRGGLGFGRSCKRWKHESVSPKTELRLLWRMERTLH